MLQSTNKEINFASPQSAVFARIHGVSLEINCRKQLAVKVELKEYFYEDVLIELPKIIPFPLLFYLFFII
jgi:hypothetical protein